ncbi:MAG: ATP-dependent Clp protease ATP-binding subunit ClpA [Bdellovibrionales bacterium RIFOXYD12_FULL_39_22]|nr:MAG: ATP-dependent Clp protease ATP-binding subunit ClpA [Bdellovibrionales bacterium RIFOXYB1_FULL_39_21]OFZ40741.1 MAG: ATP-dependent Clp protease ATP-binding subunit ClpA [Bdellovibrionales bacterium RIFOXYC12_FULL_39_17]OFZ48163.1 MAG: ATP-dependent Clp protease ATP-binding subunit ClpA [Bdellovibrionales bacterium RIFOXYC1_FULL_39_130]OFZ75813.1 MAG: ATP-dependent Clp protease ATP-binding subunit ClpA [Bdellovibrionales bacterium RIFOXYD1_FULL_39_84]OFZ76128.1 MAG: ATP-dependent Clp pro
MMGHKLDNIFNIAIKKANELKHEYVSMEVTLWALLTDAFISKLIESCGVVVADLRQELEAYLADGKNFSVLSEQQVGNLSKVQFPDEKIREVAKLNGILYQPDLTLALQRVLQRAMVHVQSAGKKEITGVNLLVAMFYEKESFAIFLLNKFGVDRNKIVEKIAHSVDRPLTDNSITPISIEGGGATIGEKMAINQNGQSALEAFTVNLNKLARENKIDPLIGREEEIERIIHVLSRRRKNNPLLVGEAGVGKTAIAEGLAWAIVNKKVPEVLHNAEIYSLDLGALLAGAKFRGDFEERLKAVLKELDKLNNESQKAILFIDEMHTLMGAGATGSGTMDASNLLRPALSMGKLKCIGSTTYDEFRKSIEKDSAFTRRFQKIDIEEPSIDDSYKIMVGLKSKYEEFHGVKFPNNVIKHAIKLSEKFISDRRLPDKAIDVLDEAGAALQILPAKSKRHAVTLRDIESVVARMAKIPEQTVVGDEKEKLRNLYTNLKNVIFGQNEAVEKVVDAVMMARSGLANPDKPQCSFLFTGPTGVGKTELAKQLAFLLGIPFKRFDMSEYMEKHAVSKLIGAPPGYIGHDNGGTLTDAIKKSPYSLLLLDEIEKAHPDIFNILLQVMDHGALTDAHGRVTDFKNTIIIMTTNAGAKEVDSGSIGFGKAQGNSDISKLNTALKNFFTPEFRNRLDGVIYFHKLSHENILRVVDKFIIKVEMLLAEKNVELLVDGEVRNWLALKGFDPQMGARPIERIIDQKIKRPLANEILFGKLIKGGSVEIKMKDKNESESIDNAEIDFIFSS